MLTSLTNIRSSKVLYQKDGHNPQDGHHPTRSNSKLGLHKLFYSKGSCQRSKIWYGTFTQQCKLIPDVRVNLPPPPLPHLTLYATKASEPRSGLLQAEHFRPKSCYCFVSSIMHTSINNYTYMYQQLYIPFDKQTRTSTIIYVILYYIRNMV